MAHSQGNKNICGGGNAGMYCGVHLFSSSAQGPWIPSSAPVYGSAARLTNGSEVMLSTRQRPQILFGPHGPLLMVNGGSFEGVNKDVNATQRTFIFEFDIDL